MLASQEVFDALKAIGLNLYERKIYIALLAKGVAAAGELSQMAGVPRSRSYDILESLAEKGFIVIQPSKPLKYVALNPKDALERVKDNLKKRFEDMALRIDRIKKSELNKIYKEGFNLVQPFEMTGTLKGRYSINQHLSALFKNAEKNIKIMTTEDGLSDLYSNHYNTLKRISKKGVKIKIIAPLRDTKPINSLSEIVELKHMENPLGRIITIDDKHIVVSLTDESKVHQTQDVAFWAQSAHMVKSVAEPLFKKFW